MVKRIKQIGLLALILLIPNLVYAASLCSYKEQVELNGMAANVKVTYEAVDIHNGKGLQLDSVLDEDPEIDVYVRGFKISILNIADELYVEVTNNSDNTKYTFKKENIIENTGLFETKNCDNLVEYTIKVYSNHPNCAGELLRTFTLQTPAYNINSNYEICKEHPNYYYCQEFLATGPITSTFFFEELEKYEENLENKKENQEGEQAKNFFEKIKEFYNKYYLWVNISIGVIIISGVTTTVILLKKKRGRVL